MNRNATPRKPQASVYQKVFDSRKRRVRGLWQRNGKFFANLTVADDLGRKTSRWVKLKGGSFTDAKDDYDRLRVERQDDRLRPLGLAPMLRDYIQDSYEQQLAASGKRGSSIEKEKSYLRRWSAKIGHLRLNKLRAHHLNKILTQLKNDKYSGRTINLFLIAIRAVLKAALRDGHIKPPLPFEGLSWHRVDTKSRQLFTTAEIDQICDVARQASKNGQSFVDYIRLMRYSGARRSEALRIRWLDVHFSNGHLTVGAEGDSKNREPRHVEFNPQLKALLLEMKQRRQPDSQWLFPSPQRGDQDASTKTFMESLRLARKAGGIVCLDCGRATVTTGADKCQHCQSKRVDKRPRLLAPKLQQFGFHDLRHHFISYAVMSGVDFMTVANWCGHQDGGILIGKIYGHLAEGHKKAQAARVTFGPTVVPLPPASTIARTKSEEPQTEGFRS